MSNAAVAIKSGADLITFEDSKLELIRKTVAKNLSAPQFELFMAVARARGLDPVLNQIHAVVRKDKDGNFNMAIQVGIDGGRLIAARTGEYAGSDAPILDLNENGSVYSASVTVYRMVQGHKASFTGIAYWDEYFPNDVKSQFMWKKMPRSQLAKCAEMLALRKGFPNDLSGLYVPEELERDVSNEIPKTLGVLEEPNHEWTARLEELFEKYSRLFVSRKEIFARYNIKDASELTREQFEELRAIGNEIQSKAKPKAFYFGATK